MEILLHYAWKYKLYDSIGLSTTTGIPVEVIDQGIHNSDAGPDFFNAKIRIGDKVWAGNVELHTVSSDWMKHRHTSNPAYRSVILHVAEEMDAPEVFDDQNRSIPQLRLKVPDQIKQNYVFLLNQDTALPCCDRIRCISQIFLSDWKNALLSERLERKNRYLLDLLNQYNGDWNAVFYITLSRNFGFGINNDAFERLAKSLPIRYILKHQDSITQVEALFFGQAGLLEEDMEDDYYRVLRNEYLFLQKKYHLKPLDGYLFKNLRIRPINFPHIKIAQLAAFVRTQEYLFSKILENSDLPDLKQLFVLDLHAYWFNHYSFGKTTIQKKKLLGLSAIDIILINTVVPILFTYGQKKQLPDFSERAIVLLEQIKPENNSIITLFKRAGIEIFHAGDTQALIQLKREYCEKKKCIFCRIGHQLLSQKITFNLNKSLNI